MIEVQCGIPVFILISICKTAIVIRTGIFRAKLNGFIERKNCIAELLNLI
jgi:hypothetical protein